MTLWGKSQAEIDEDHRRMLADRVARQQAATPQDLGKRYGQALQPYQPTQQERIDAMVRETAVRREYHFGTDIPRPTWEEVEAERARQGLDDVGFGVGRLTIWALVAFIAILGALVIYVALK